MRFWLTMLIFIPFVATFSGCASSSSAKQQKMTNDRVAVLTNEVVRLDAALRETGEALRIQQERNQELEAQLARSSSSRKESSSESGAGVYKTPSGFELPSRDIQTALQNAGFYNGTIDGKIGPGTRNAIRAFQEANGLTADGVCGRGTWEKLKTYLHSEK